MSWELAQLNIAALLAPLDSPVLADFVAELDRINELADQAPGFVWRLRAEDAEAAVDADIFGERFIVNISVWKTKDELHSYIYRTAHAQVMSRRKEWFERMSDASSVLWWVPEGHRPTTTEAKQRLERLKKEGPGFEAFTFKQSFLAPTEQKRIQRT